MCCGGRVKPLGRTSVNAIVADIERCGRRRDGDGARRLLGLPADKRWQPGGRTWSRDQLYDRPTWLARLVHALDARRACQQAQARASSRRGEIDFVVSLVW
jgi:hypothetical protein